MARYKLQGRARDTWGNTIASLDIYIYKAGTSRAVDAIIYTSKTSTTAISAAPQISSDVYGFFSFWVDDTDYTASTTKFDIYADGLEYTYVDIFNIKHHGTLSGLPADDHPRYPSVSAAEVIPGRWTFTAPITGVIPSAAKHFATKDYVDATASVDLSAGSGLIENPNHVFNVNPDNSTIQIVSDEVTVIQGGIDHVNIQNIGTNTHSQIDSLLLSIETSAADINTTLNDHIASASVHISQTYIDDGDVSTLASANSYTDAASANLQTYSDATSANALVQANLYTDAASAAKDEHNELNNIQGGIPSASEYYHLSESIHDSLYSASPLIGLGDQTGVNLEVDYGSDHIDFNGPIQIDRAFEMPNPESIVPQGSIIGKSTLTEYTSIAHGISPLIKECGICVFRNKIWVVGGVLVDKLTKVNTVYSSADFGRTWTLETASAFAVARDELYVLSFKGYMYAIGGDNGSGLTDVYRTLDGITWTKVGDLPFVSRQGTAVVFNGKMFYYGGFTGSGDQIFYSSDGATWSTASQTLPIGLLRAKPVVYDNAVWLIGGATGSPTWTTGVQKIFKSTDGFNFSEVGTDSLPTKIDGCIPLAFQGKMYIVGGNNQVLTLGNQTNKIYESMDGLTWTEVGTNALLPIAATGTFWLLQGGVVINGRFWFGFGSELDLNVLDPATHFMYPNLDSFKLNSGVFVDKILDENTMSSNDPNALTSQQSIKAYADAHANSDGSSHSLLSATPGTAEANKAAIISGTNTLVGIKAMGIGTSDTVAGYFVVYGNNTTGGGTIDLHLGQSYNGAIDLYSMRVVQDDLYIGPDHTLNSLKYDGGTNQWISSAAGGLQVVSGDLILNEQHILIQDSGSTVVELSDSAIIKIGFDDVLAGQLWVFSDAAGGQGGEIRLHTCGEDDDSINYYVIEAQEDDLTIGPTTDPDSLKYDGGLDQWIFSTDVQISGDLEYLNISTVTAQTTASNSDVILANAPSGSPFTVYLQESDNASITIKKIDPDENTTVEGLSGNIDGIANKVLTTQYERATFVWDGTNWFII